MNLRAVLHLVSILLVVLALAIALCAAVAWLHQDDATVIRGFLISAGAVLLSAVVMWVTTRGPIDLTRRDGFGIVTFGWLAAAIFGALPYLFTQAIPDPVTAVFETMSGFTTTGASALTDLETLPKGVLFWRSMTQWFGGMGVLVLCVAILPFLGVGGMQIYRAEMPGPSKDRLTPRITSTAKLLWGVYVLLTVSQALLLMLGGLGWFDAVCHAFTTLSTGGFSTRSASIAAFDSTYVEIVVILFMFLAGINFALHFRVLRGQVGSYFRDPEFRFYVFLWLGACLFLTVNTLDRYDLGTALRSGFFTGTSILTTTGYCTENFDLWPSASRFLLLALMFVGGCAGSTAGGIKIVRVFVVLKKTLREIRLFLMPRAVVQVKLGQKPLEPDVVSNISAFFIIFMLLYGVGTFVMSLFTPDLVTAGSAVAATLGNIGPGLAGVGATQNYAFIAAPGKLVLTFLMLLGRLELYTVLALLLPTSWRK